MKLNHLFFFSLAAFGAHFAQQPSDVVVIAGKSVTLPCVVIGYRGVVQWTMDGLALGAERDLPGMGCCMLLLCIFRIFHISPESAKKCYFIGWSRYSIVGDHASGEHNLRIEGVELGDDAIYECQATQAALRSQRAHLTVLGEY